MVKKVRDPASAFALGAKDHGEGGIWPRSLRTGADRDAAEGGGFWWEELPK